MPIAEFGIQSPILRRALRAAPDAIATLEEQYVYDAGTRFLFWVETEDFEAFESGLDDDETVTNPELLAETPTKRLYRIDLTEQGEAASTYSTKLDLDIVFLDARGTAEGWTMRMLFPSEETISEYYEVCREQGFSPEVQSKYSERTAGGPVGSDLTTAQREALETAFEMGYFEVPRESSLKETADALDISRQATSERIRRGVSALVERELQDTL